ncbi:MAG: hypothetical protein OSB51_10420, partial [Dokdonia donghaensis]|nr:hypothetical protein [Dokdonia donghaensis]
MKTHKKPLTSQLSWLLALCLVLAFTPSTYAQKITNYIEVKGKIAESESKDEIAKATVTLMGTNLSTVSNNEGEFALKIPAKDAN